MSADDKDVKDRFIIQEGDLYLSAPGDGPTMEELLERGESAEIENYSLPSDQIAADSRSSKVVAHYVDHPVDGKRCADCSMFRAPRSCTAVLGDISPDGHCRYWAARA